MTAAQIIVTPQLLNPPNVHAPAHVGNGAAALAARAESEVATRTRDLDLISKLRAHVRSPRILQMIDRLKHLMLTEDYAGGAPVRAAEYPAGHPRFVANAVTGRPAGRLRAACFAAPASLRLRGALFVVVVGAAARAATPTFPLSTHQTQTFVGANGRGVSGAVERDPTGIPILACS